MGAKAAKTHSRRHAYEESDGGGGGAVFSLLNAAMGPVQSHHQRRFDSHFQQHAHAHATDREYLSLSTSGTTQAVASLRHAREQVVATKRREKERRQQQTEKSSGSAAAAAAAADGVVGVQVQVQGVTRKEREKQQRVVTEKEQRGKLLQLKERLVVCGAEVQKLAQSVERNKGNTALESIFRAKHQDKLTELQLIRAAEQKLTTALQSRTHGNKMIF